MNELTEDLLSYNQSNQEDQDMQAALQLDENLGNLPNLDEMHVYNCSGVYDETQCKDFHPQKTLFSHVPSEKMFLTESDPEKNVLSELKSHLDNRKPNEHENFPAFLPKPDMVSTNHQSTPFIGDSFGKKVPECKSRNEEAQLDVMSANDSDILPEETRPARVLNEIKQYFPGLSWVYSSGDVAEDFPTQETTYVPVKTNSPSVTLSAHFSTTSKPHTLSQNDDSCCATSTVGKSSSCEKFPELILSKTVIVTSSDSKETSNPKDISPNSMEISADSKETSSSLNQIPLGPKGSPVSKETSCHFKKISSASEEISTNSKKFSSNFEKTFTDSDQISSNSEILPDCAETLLSPKRNSSNSEEASPHSDSKGIVVYSETLPNFKEALADFKKIQPNSEEILSSTKETSLDKEILPNSEMPHIVEDTALNFQGTSPHSKEMYFDSKETSPDSEEILHDSKETSLASDGTLHDSTETSPDLEKTTYDLKENSPDSEDALHYLKDTSYDSEGTLPHSKETSHDLKKTTHDSKETLPSSVGTLHDSKETSPELETSSDSEGTLHDSKEISPYLEKTTYDSEGISLVSEGISLVSEEILPVSEETSPYSKKTTYDSKGVSPVSDGTSPNSKETSPESEGSSSDLKKTSPESKETSPNLFFPKGKVYDYAKIFGIQKFSLLESTDVGVNLKTPTPDERHKWKKMDHKYIQKECYRVGINPGTFYSSTKGYFVEVPNGVNYDIILTNENPVPCNVDVFIDNGSAPTICFRLNPGAPKKFDGPPSCREKFVFLRSKDAPSESGIKESNTNGLIEAIFTPQKIETLRTRTVSEPEALSRGTSNILGLIGIDKVNRKLRSYTTSGSVERGVNISNFCQGATALRGEQSKKSLKEADPMEVDEAKQVIIRLRLIARVDDPSVPCGEDICSLYPPSVEELQEN